MLHIREDWQSVWIRQNGIWSPWETHRGFEKRFGARNGRRCLSPCNHRCCEQVQRYSHDRVQRGDLAGATHHRWIMSDHLWTLSSMAFICLSGCICSAFTGHLRNPIVSHERLQKVMNARSKINLRSLPYRGIPKSKTHYYLQEDYVF